MNLTPELDDLKEEIKAASAYMHSFSVLYNHVTNPKNRRVHTNNVVQPSLVILWMTLETNFFQFYVVHRLSRVALTIVYAIFLQFITV